MNGDLDTPCILADDIQILLRIKTDFAAKTCQGDKTTVDLRDRGQHGRVFTFQAAAVYDLNPACLLFDEACE